MSKNQIWTGPDGVIIPSDKTSMTEIVPYANNLTPKQQNQIIAAYNAKAFDMAAEYAWKKAIVKLKETIATLGMTFIGELLQRDDIDEYTPIDAVLTDFATIQLAEQLGVINKTASIKLKHAQELITHYFSNQSGNDELDAIDAASIIKSSVQYILGEQNISIAIEFSNFRDRLLGESLKADDIQVKQIIDSPLFYLRTVSSVLSSSIKNDKGATLEHALGNINLILPYIWEQLSDSDKWNIGETYRDVVANGNATAAAGMKNVLTKVKGFDFVPESLRSSTFKNLARTVIETHFAFNNFYNEPRVVSALANLGTIIPPPAFIECIQAYLLVYLGNAYGVSTDAAHTAKSELSKIGRERWQYYFEKVIHKDNYIINNLSQNRQIERFNHLLISNKLNDFSNLPKENQFLYNAIISNDFERTKRVVATINSKIR